MERATDAVAELRDCLLGDRPIDQARCRRLILRATSRIADVRRASELSDELGVRISATDMAEILGSDRQFEVDHILELLDEVEALSRPT